MNLHKFTQHPIWYIVVISTLVGAAQLFGWPWWLVSSLALGWGVWLLWQSFYSDAASQETHLASETYLQQALLYRTQIEHNLEEAGTGYNAAHRRELSTQVEVSVGAIENLEQHLSKLRRNVLIQQDADTLPHLINDLEEQISREPDQSLRRQLEGMLTNRKKQVASLAYLQQNTKQVEIHIENTLALLGTIYAQVLTARSTNQVADYRRLAAKVEEETDRLQDQLEALIEVKEGFW